jgi:hypothetical protein
MRHFLQVLYNERDLSILKRMEDVNLLLLYTKYCYETLSKMMYEEAGILP